MSQEERRKKFRRQYSDEQWSRLYANAEFKAAWDSGNIDRAWEVANPMIYGEVNTVQQVRSRLHKLGDACFD